jgi:succinate dehydrogenase / fumarate reductase flavoprotein subunit/fumarate reductase (CoM/CoB) subunit A
MYPRGRSPEDGPVGVSPIQHYFCGGVVTDEYGCTGTPGVYACGEVAGGIDGANRVGGNALTTLAVFGPIAGESAARFARSRGSRRSPSIDADGRGRPASTAQFMRLWAEGGGMAPAELKSEINRICDANLGPIRTADGLREALRSLASLRAETARLSARSPSEVVTALECEAMLVAAWMVAEGALRRTESRGVHYRSDYPTEDPHLAGPLYARPVLY